MVVEKLPSVGLYFRFYGDAFDPDEITRRLGVEPTKKFRLGEPITEDGRARWPSYGWIIEVGPRKALDIEDMLPELRERADVSPKAVKQLCADLNLDLVITCGVGVGEADDYPGMFFPADFLAWVVELGASVNVDVMD
jgi:hypothetical protein